MEIKPATLTQITRARDGRMVLIDDDIGNVAHDLHEIDPGLRLRYSEAGRYFVVYWQEDGEEDGNGHLVLTAEECDQRIIQRVKEIMRESYDYVAELDKLEEQKQKDADYKLSQQVGEASERLAFALRKERQVKNRAFVTRSLNGDPPAA